MYILQRNLKYKCIFELLKQIFLNFFEIEIPTWKAILQTSIQMRKNGVKLASFLFSNLNRHQNHFRLCLQLNHRNQLILSNEKTRFNVYFCSILQFSTKFTFQIIMLIITYLKFCVHVILRLMKAQNE